MKLLKALSYLLDYPTIEVQEHIDSLIEVIQVSNLTPETKRSLHQFCFEMKISDVLGLQAEYDELFDRGRSYSLLIFEHIHGESRDRGQAMVDLLAQYQQAGLSLNKNELPDFLPLYLEFLSTQGDIQGPMGLEEIAHVLALLFCRLEKRKSPYQHIFMALLETSGVQIDLTDLREQMKEEKDDSTPEEIDKIWEEEQVTFGPAGDTDGCSTGHKPSKKQNKADFVPISWASNTDQNFKSEQSS